MQSAVPDACAAALATIEQIESLNLALELGNVDGFATRRAESKKRGKLRGLGLSNSIALSFLALMVYGAADSISVVIRQSLIQMRTPWGMLGRVAHRVSWMTRSHRMTINWISRRD